MVRARLIVTLGCIAVICAGCVVKDESSDSDGSGGSRISTLNFGGQAAAGPSTGGQPSLPGTGGTTPGAGGSTAAGGFISILGEPNFDTLCRGDQTVGFVIGCLAVYEASYVIECVAQWEALASNCPSETEALAHCWMVQEILDHNCNEDDRVVLAQGICVEELASVEACR